MPLSHAAPARRSCVLATLVLGACLAPAAHATDSLVTDFETDAPGALPGTPWRDVVELVGKPNVPSPTAVVIDTLDPWGEPTRAVQTVESVGTSQGIWFPADLGPNPDLRVRVRIDQFGSADQVTWPMAVGFTANVSEGDLNNEPQAVVYAYNDARWYIFILPGGGLPAVNGMFQAPPIELGQWYRIRLQADLATGAFTVRIRNAQNNAFLGGGTVTVPGWDPQLSPYDGVAFFDGDYESTGPGSMATIDDIIFNPPPPCPLDLNGSGAVDFADVLQIIADWGPCPGCPSDLDGDGETGMSDLLAVLSDWGPCV